MNEKRFLLHCDEISWGLYEFPLHMSDVSPNPHRAKPASEWREMRSAREAKGGVRVYGPLVPLRPDKDGRAAPAAVPVHSWFRTGEAAAPIVLFEALPGYWLNRFRYVGPARNIRTDVTPTLDMASFHDRRMPHRERLVNHSTSLKQKAWSLKYHRGNLLSAIERANSSPHDLHAFTVAGAEYGALSHCLYSVLEELAAVLGLLRVMQGLPATPNSFHGLHQKAAEQPEELRKLLADATWYEPFRVERANSAHSFGTFLGFARGTTDMQWFQHPDPRIYSGTACTPASARAAEAHVDELLNGSDLLIAGLCRHMLTLFHPWDIVKFHHADPGEPPAMEQTTVWVKEISFSRDAPYGLQSWALLDENGVMRCRTDDRGGISKLETHDETC